MGRRSREHRRAVIAGVEKPVSTPTSVQLVLRCGKCRALVVESRVTLHLKECQPGGARCGKCGGMFKPEIFLDHFKACPGPKKSVPVEIPPGPLGDHEVLVDKGGQGEVSRG